LRGDDTPKVDLMRTAFHDQLATLTDSLGEMCEVAGTAMERATHALLHADLLEAEQVITDHDRLVRMKTHAEETAFVLLALQSPVAGDLRAVVSTMQNVADAERMGGLALHVAKIARRCHPSDALPEEVSEYFAEMGKSPSTL
jgi:phosphate transport system protein